MNRLFARYYSSEILNLLKIFRASAELAPSPSGRGLGRGDCNKIALHPQHTFRIGGYLAQILCKNLQYLSPLPGPLPKGEGMH